MGIFSKIVHARFLAASVLNFALVLLPLSSAAQWNPVNPVQSSQKDVDGLTIILERGALRFQVCTDSLIRVLYSPQREFPHVAEYVVIKSDWPKTPFDANQAAEPLFVKAGSIVPMGPTIEYAQQSQDPIELRVYTGADGDFTVYQYDGNTYDYEKGAHSTIALHWDDASRTLTSAEQKGRFSGMAASLKFHVVLVGRNHGAAETVTENPDTILNDTGSAVRWKP